MIKKKDCIKIGTITKAHGVKGEVIVQFDTDIFEVLKETESIFIEIDGYLVPFFLENIRTKSQTDFLLMFRDMDQKTLDTIIGCDMYQYQELIPEADITFEPEQLIGFVLFDDKKTRIGIITEFIDIPGNPNLQVDYLNTEILIPFNDDLVISFDPVLKNLIMTIPEGLLGLY